jgi:hypothetical protein
VIVIMVMHFVRSLFDNKELHLRSVRGPRVELVGNPVFLLDKIAREGFQYQGYLKAPFLQDTSPCGFRAQKTSGSESQLFEEITQDDDVCCVIS